MRTQIVNTINSVVGTCKNIWNDRIQQIKSIYGRNLSDGEFETFVQVGKATSLNPFLREIWAVKYGNTPAQIFIGRDGYRKSAQANHTYDYHHVDAVYSNDEFNYDFDSGKVNHKYNFKDRGKLVGAYCLVKKNTSTRAIYVFVEFDEYNKGQSVWKEKPATMIKKVAEAQCLRMAFQELFGGTYFESETFSNSSGSNVARSIPIDVQAIDITNEDTSDFSSWITDIENAESTTQLASIFSEVKKCEFMKDKGCLVKIIDAKDKRKIELAQMVKDFNDEIDVATGEVKQNEENNNETI